MAELGVPAAVPLNFTLLTPVKFDPLIVTVEPTGPIEDDPNLTDKKFPGNPTKSFRTREPLRVIGEVTDWKGHPPEQLAAMRARLAELARLGVEAIDD